MSEQSGPAAASTSKPLSFFDTATWKTSDNKNMRSSMVALMVLDRGPDWERLHGRLERLTRLVPVLRQRVVEGATGIGNPRLVVDPAFDLDYHIQHFSLTGPGDLAQVLDIARKISMDAFDKGRPLWQMTFLDGMAGGGAAAIIKLHHAIADGQAAVLMMANLLDLTRDAVITDPMPPAPQAGDISRGMHAKETFEESVAAVRAGVDQAVRNLPAAAMDAAKHPREAAAELVDSARSVLRFAQPHSGPLSPVMTERTMNWDFRVIDVPLDKLKTAAKSNGRSVNDAFVAGVTGGLRRYHEAKGSDVEELRANIPVSTRSGGPGSGGNAVTIARMELPVANADPVARMEQISKSVASWREEPALNLTEQIAMFSKVVPASVVGDIATTADFTASNVPGAPIPVYLSGAEVLRMYPLMGPVGAAVNVTLLSYNGVCCIGMGCDAAAIPDPDFMSECMAAGFEEVLALAG